MAASNRDRVGAMFEAIAGPLDEFIQRVVGPDLAEGQSWTSLVAARDMKKRISGKKYSATDPQLSLRMLTENITGQLSRGGTPSTTTSRGSTSPTPPSCVSTATTGRTTPPSPPRTRNAASTPPPG